MEGTTMNTARGDAIAPAPRRLFDRLLAIEGLTQTDRLIALALDRHTRLGHDCWCATATIARWVNRSVSTVRAALARLRASGLVRVVRNYMLRSRRAIVLLWREPEASAQSAERALPESDLAPNSSVLPHRELGTSVAAPPHPPCIELNEVRSEVSSAAGANAPPSRAVPSLHPECAETGDASRSVVTEAERLFGNGAAARARALVKRYGTEWVQRALDRAARLRARGRAVVWGYVATCLFHWSEEGGPPPEAVAQPPRDELLRLAAEQIKAVMARERHT
jgi:hypothetical protein